MKHVLIAGATGYLGRYLCVEYQHRGWEVSALVRKNSRHDGLHAHRLIEAEATWPEALTGCMADVDLVVSALGITRQTDGMRYWDVDYQANANLLDEALRSDVRQFAYVHVLNADRMGQVPLVAAKSAFVRKLRAAPIASNVIAPTGYFSDMADFLTMARAGRIWLFGDGQQRINPIHGADLAKTIFDAVVMGESHVPVGGPETYTQNDLARLCFALLNRPARITHLPDFLRRAALHVLPRITPRRIAGPAQFFLTASSMNMTAPPTGNLHLAEHLKSTIDQMQRDQRSRSCTEKA